MWLADEGREMIPIQASPITLDDKVFSTVELLALAALDGQKQRLISDCLAIAELTRQSLAEPSTKVSLRQMLRIISSCCTLLDDPMLALRAGQQLHLTAYGLFGLTLLSSASLEDALDTANDFALLMNLKHRLHLRRQEGQARLLLVDNFPLLGSDKFCCALLETAKVLTLLGDILGHGFEATRVSLAIAGGEREAEAIGRLLRVPVTLNSPENSICFDPGLLDASLPQSHSITHNACKALCQTQLQAITQPYDLCYQVQRILLASTDRIPTLPEIADRLHLSPRTLRRRLEAADTSYNQILEDVRRKLAIRYLLDTRMTTEAISEKLSYSDAANFRHAFKRWTGSGPKAFRSQNREPDYLPAGFHALAGQGSQPAGMSMGHV